MCKWRIILKCFQGVKKVIWLDIGLKVLMFLVKETLSR